MLHPPAPISAAAAKARRSVDAVKRILVPTLGMPYSERGVELACRLGQEQKAEIVLIYVLEVPRTMPLGISMPDAEGKAREALERAQSIVALHGLSSVIDIQRAREAGEGIIRAARDHDVDLIVIGIRPRLTVAQDIVGRTADFLLRRAPCEVIINKLPG